MPARQKERKMTFSSIAAVILVFCYITRCFRIVKEDEVAVLVTLGRPRRVVKSGFIFVLFLFQWLKKYPTHIVVIPLREMGLVTVGGKVKFVQNNPSVIKLGENQCRPEKAGSSEQTEEETNLLRAQVNISGEETTYGEARITITPTLCFTFPENNDLMEKTIRRVGDPYNKEKLKDLFEEPTIDAIRSVGGSKLWRMIALDRKKLAEETVITLQDEENDPIKLAGLTNVKIILAHMKLPTGLEEAITKPEIARLEGAALRTAKAAEADGIKKTRGAANDMERDRIKKVNAEIAGNPSKERMELVYAFREMATGPNNTMLVLPPEIAATLSNILGTKKNIGSIGDAKNHLLSVRPWQATWLWKNVPELLVAMGLQKADFPQMESEQYKKTATRTGSVKKPAVEDERGDKK